eukprot:6182910-Pleurochrysis_carterae.AAC.1
MCQADEYASEPTVFNLAVATDNRQVSLIQSSDQQLHQVQAFAACAVFRPAGEQLEGLRRRLHPAPARPRATQRPPSPDPRCRRRAARSAWCIISV